MNQLIIYAAGEIHSDWRDRLREALDDRGVDAVVVGPQEDHPRSDSVGEDILGEQPNARYRDLAGARVNAIRRRIQMQNADLVVARFGDQYRQWNTALDVGTATAHGLPTIVVRDPELHHALKEVDAAVTMTVDTLEQAAEAVAYVFE